MPTVKMTSWFTDRAMQLHDRAGTAPAGGLAPRPADAGRAVDWPELRPEGSQVDGGDEPASILVPLSAPSHLDDANLSYDEDDLVRVVAAVAAAAQEETRRGLAAGFERRRADALAALAPAVRGAVRQHAEDHDRMARHLAALAEAIAAAFAGSAASAAGMTLRAAMAELLATLPGAASLKITAAPSTAEELRLMVPDLLQAMGRETVALEIAADPGLPEHMVQAAWSDGWVEFVPTELHRRVAEVLTAYLPPRIEAAGPSRHDDRDSLAEQG